MCSEAQGKRGRSAACLPSCLSQLPHHALTLAARWVVTSEDEQAVSTVRAGPFRPNV